MLTLASRSCFAALIGISATTVAGADENAPATVPGYVEINQEGILWQWMKTQEAEGHDLLAIPHNSNPSKGRTFPDIDSFGEPVDLEYARLRQHFEPLVEMMQVKGLSFGGRVLSNAEISVLVNKLSITQSFDVSIFGGTPAFNVNIPYAASELEFDSIIAGSNRRITNEDQGFGDITLTPLHGWHDGKLHYSAGVSVFLPVGLYNTTTVNVPARKVNALSFGKNVVSIQPVGALTYPDTDTGIEVSGAASREAGA